MGLTNVAITQMASENDWAKNCDKAERLVREAAAKGAHLVLLQELFDGDYFCIEQHAHFLKRAEEIDRHPTVKRFAALAKELGVVLPVSVFERAGNVHYNTTVIVDADGRQLVQALDGNHFGQQRTGGIKGQYLRIDGNHLAIDLDQRR